MVANDLRPSGTVLIDGKSYSALSLGPVIESGVKVKVVKKEGFSLGVAEIEGKVGQAVPPKSDRAGGYLVDRRGENDRSSDSALSRSDLVHLNVFC